MKFIGVKKKMPKFKVNNYGKFIEIETTDRSIVVYCSDDQLQDLYEQLDKIYGNHAVDAQMPKEVLGTIKMTIEDSKITTVEVVS